MILQKLSLWLGVLAAALSTAGGVGDVFAREGQWGDAEQVRGRLISLTENVGSSKSLTLGLQLELKPGWKTYWRTPGDAGLPPELDWSQSRNFERAELSYPRPVRFQLFGLQTFGYEKHVVFPITVELEQAGRAADLRLKANLLVCEQVCIPQVLDLRLHVPEGKASAGAESHVLQKFLAQVPAPGNVAGLDVSAVRTTRASGQEALEVEIKTDDGRPLSSPDVVVEIEPYVAFKAPVVEMDAGGKSAQLTLALASPLPAGQTLAGQTAVLTVLDESRAAETTAGIREGDTAVASETLSLLAAMIAIAFLGGLILNLMPCVLPVLSIKLLSLVKAREMAATKVRSKFLATAAGIVVSLLALAAILLAIKSGGVAIGWGVQFQQPLFISVMAVIVTLFACNLWGLFEFELPSQISNWAGQQGRDNDRLMGHFLTGVFVTLLATPCSAPFVGTAVGFALASDAITTLAMFFSLGLGLATPYLLVAAIPSLAGLMPKPGPWMVYLRWLLGLALAATAVWLLTVLAEQTGKSVAAVTALLLAGLAGVLAIRSRRAPLLAPGAVSALLWLLAAGAVAYPSLVQTGSSGGAGAKDEVIAWQDFDRAHIRSLIAQGKTVFVDVTADWCITCQANKRLVLNQPPVSERLNGSVIAMKADWTSPDPAITAFLESFGRFGIPMNVVFGPGEPAGLLLPELLSAQAVTDALERASWVPAPSG